MRPSNPVLSLLLAVLSVWLVSCHRVDPSVAELERGEIPHALPGEYAFRSKSGQIESMTINADGTYRHELYDDEKTYVSHGAPLFALQGKLTPKKGKLPAILLNFGSDASRVTENPGPKDYSDLPWVSDWNGKPTILFSEDWFYWLVKVRERADIRTAEFRRQYP